MTELDSKLNNNYVKGYYDNQVKKMGDSYTDSRWHTTPIQEFEYNQTSRALDRALGNTKYGKVIEVGPGDGVWTKKIIEHTEERIHLVEQSVEMLDRAKRKLFGVSNITFERSDFMESNPPKGNDLVIAIRCFEYFSDKDSSVKKMFDLLSPGGKLVIVTKNSKLLTSVSVQGKKVHSDQLSRIEMRNLLLNNGFEYDSIYSAVFRWKIRYGIMRFVFDVLHRVSVWSKGIFAIPFLTTYATESFVYVVTKPKS
ncbi:MAG: trans-aconitate methyltransferase [Candidatus Paceibacteria bacterium]|jgi:trans-aconitate methyltransferase